MSNTKESQTKSIPDTGSDSFQYDLGILLVHGIGEQKKGVTLRQIGDVLCSWINRWFTYDTQRKRTISGPPLTDPFVQIRKTVIGQNGTNIGEPAHSELSLKISIDGEQSNQVWLLAESGWASSITPPTYLDFIKWAYLIVPWIISTSFVRLSRRGRVSAAVGFILSPLVSFLFFILMALPAILSIFPKFKDFVMGIQRIVAGILGDVFLYAEKPHKPFLYLNPSA